MASTIKQSATARTVEKTSDLIGTWLDALNIEDTRGSTLALTAGRKFLPVSHVAATQALVTDVVIFTDKVGEYLPGGAPVTSSRFDIQEAVGPLATLSRQFEKLQSAYQADGLAHISPEAHEIVSALTDLQATLARESKANREFALPAEKLDALLHKHQSVIAGTIATTPDENARLRLRDWARSYYRESVPTVLGAAKKTIEVIPHWVKRPAALATLALALSGIASIRYGAEARDDWHDRTDRITAANQDETKREDILRHAVDAEAPDKVRQAAEGPLEDALADGKASSIAQATAFVEQHAGSGQRDEFNTRYKAYLQAAGNQPGSSVGDEGEAYKSATDILENAAKNAYPESAAEDFLQPYEDKQEEGKFSETSERLATLKGFIAQHGGQDEAANFAKDLDDAQKTSKTLADAGKRSDALTAQSEALSKQADGWRDQAADAKSDTEGGKLTDKADAATAKAEDLTTQANDASNGTEGMQAQVDADYSDAHDIAARAADNAFPKDAASVFAAQFEDASSRIRNETAATAFIAQHAGQDQAKAFTTALAQAQLDGKFYDAAEIMRDAATKAFPDIDLQSVADHYKGLKGDEIHTATDFVRAHSGPQAAAQFEALSNSVRNQPEKPDGDEPGHKKDYLLGIALLFTSLFTARRMIEGTTLESKIDDLINS